jgi:hypothetical protein
MDHGNVPESGRGLPQGRGFPFGIGIGQTADSVDAVGAFFHAFGAEVVDARGNVTVRNDNVRQVLDYSGS